MERDPYLVLGLERGASPEDARSAYRRLVEIYHPDRFVDARSEVRVEAETRMKELNLAYQRVKDSQVPSPTRQPSHSGAGRPSPSSPPPQPGPRPRASSSDDLGATSIQCSGCRTGLRVPGTAKAYRCPNCRDTYRFARCGHCTDVAHVPERVGVWRCPKCQHPQRSFWTTQEVVNCFRCESLNAFSPGSERFSCTQCGTTHHHCGCGAYVVVPGSGRRWVCPSCRRRNRR